MANGKRGDTGSAALQLLDCTLRDGSYAINFQFTADETGALCRALEQVGLHWIEIGHGVGLGATARGYGAAAETDEAYMQAASEALQQARWGVFCIPGIATLEMLDQAAGMGMGFVRIGTNLETYRDVAPFVERARHHGLFVCVNFMKSYTEPPDTFARYAAEAARFGADLVYLVDSAGGMLPEEVARYLDAVAAEAPDLRLGFHGHNNLGLAVANSLVAVEHGAEFVDVSLQGLGRSAGNTPTEQLLCVLMRRGIDLDMDPVALFEVAERLVHPLVSNRGIDTIDVTAGLALFHSSYMSTIETYAREFRVDPRRLIIAVAERDRVNAPEAMVREVAQDLAEAGVRGSWKALYKKYYGYEQT